MEKLINKMPAYRTHNCGELSIAHVGQQVKLAGWVHRKRDHGGVFFIDLRDHYGITQLVSSNQEARLLKISSEQYEILSSVSYESVISITGIVIARTPDTVNKHIYTGEIEVIIENYTIESVAGVLPLTVNSDQNFPEEIRLEYRFLDLRRETLHNNIMLRNKVISYIRTRMHELGFSEFQTPILTASSPEGARDFLVPSRLHPGKFYALPQAPQQFKQLLMVAGFDRYFQIAPCFRDEDARADRAPGEFYQLDIEMSFVTQEDVFSTIEPVMHGTFDTFSNHSITAMPFPRITYKDAMLQYGTDKPDLRNPLVICDVTNIFRDSNFTIFREAIKQNAVIRAIPAPLIADKSRSFFDGMITFAQTELSAKGLAYITFSQDGTAKGPIAKLLTLMELEAIKTASGIKNGAIFFVCEQENAAVKIAGRVRQKLGEELDLIEKNSYRMCWIVDFPFYEWNEDESKIDFSHNPFSMPQGGMKGLEAADTIEKQLAIIAYQYDIVCNGIELSSGAIRNHHPELMYKAFELAGYPKDVVDERFGAMIKAFKYGAPPHGGIAPGVDRIVMLLANEPNIREVIAFPLNQKGQDLMMNAPTAVSDRHLKELHIHIVNPPR
ncbi:Aspartate--tRNA(Asp/Asn) ligase [Alphaproteobacteria bacterium]